MADGPGGSHVVGKVSVRVVPNTAMFRRELKAQLERLNERVKVGFDVDDRAAKARLRDLQRELHSLSGAAHVDVHIGEAKAKERMRVLLHELHAQARTANIQVDTDIDAQGFKRAAIQLDNIAQSAGSAAANSRGIGRAGLITGAVFAAAAPAVGLVAGLLASLPALVSSFAAGSGAIAMRSSSIG